MQPHSSPQRTCFVCITGTCVSTQCTLGEAVGCIGHHMLAAQVEACKGLQRPYVTLHCTCNAAAGAPGSGTSVASSHRVCGGSAATRGGACRGCGLPTYKNILRIPEAFAGRRPAAGCMAMHLSDLDINTISCQMQCNPFPLPTRAVQNLPGAGVSSYCTARGGRGHTDTACWWRRQRYLTPVVLKMIYANLQLTCTAVAAAPAAAVRLPAPTGCSGSAAARAVSLLWAAGLPASNVASSSCVFKVLPGQTLVD